MPRTTIPIGDRQKKSEEIGCLSPENEKHDVSPMPNEKFKTGHILRDKLKYQSVLQAKSRAEQFVNDLDITARQLATISEKFHSVSVGRGKFTEEVALELLNRISRGETLKSICQDAHMPSYQQVMKWIKTDPDFQTAYASAQEFRMNVFADEILEIADNATGDIRLGFDKQGNVIPEVNVEAIQRSKLRIETRKYLMERYAKQTFGAEATKAVKTATATTNGQQVQIQINLPSNDRPIASEVIDV